MKYLAYFKPNRSLADLIKKQKHVTVPVSRLHYTLCYFPMDPDYEDALISDLSQLEFDPFEVETVGFEDLDDNSLVLRLSSPTGLVQLHKNIVSAVWRYAEQGFEDIAEQYYRSNYIPHITLVGSSSEFDRTSEVLIGQRNRITRYSLARRLGGVWKNIVQY